MKPGLSLLLLGALLLAPFASHAAGPSVSVSGVWIRAAAQGADVMAGYLVLTNHTGAPLTLTSIASPDFGSVSVQQSVQHGDTNGTQSVARLAIPAHQSTTLAPGGDHLTLMKPAKPLFEGDLVTLTLNFSDGSSLTILAPVRQNAPAH